ncbi:ArgE/DapE family deacylase [Candidatus Bathyarchaeota archaeon]|nr:ArgE/DapE family deacylase [Candidatus Bathyarchaeota archaeon]
MNEVEKRVLENVDLDGLLGYTSELIAIPSHGGMESAAQRNVAAKLGALGLDVDVWEIDFDELKRHPDFSMSLSREEGLGVVGTLGGGKGRDLILCGHIDTVAPGDPGNWETPALKADLREGKLYGRGSADMKGGLACAIYAVKAVIDSELSLNGRVILESAIGEEDGGCGTLATCLRGYTADAGIVMEPSGTVIAPEVAGAMSFRVTVPGRAAHACVREEGVSAVEKFIALHEGLRTLEKERNERFHNPLYRRYSIPHAISIGTVKGGQWPGSVPEKVVFEGRMGVAVGEPEADARRELEAKVAEVADADLWLRENPPKVDWVGYSFASSRISVDHPIVETLGGAYRDIASREPGIEGMTYASDVRHLINVGRTPTTVFGPGDVRAAHGPDEYVEVDELELTVKTLALTILRYVGYAE